MIVFAFFRAMVTSGNPAEMESRRSVCWVDQHQASKQQKVRQPAKGETKADGNKLHNRSAGSSKVVYNENGIAISERKETEEKRLQQKIQRKRAVEHCFSKNHHAALAVSRHAKARTTSPAASCRLRTQRGFPRERRPGVFRPTLRIVRLYQGIPFLPLLRTTALKNQCWAGCGKQGSNIKPSRRLPGRFFEFITVVLHFLI